MPASVSLKAAGLNTSPNQLDAVEGSLTTASNVVIKRDNIVEARRGFGLFGDSFGDSTSRAKQLMVYKQRIIRHFETTLQYQDGVNNDGSAKFTDFSGSYSEALDGRRLRSIESNGNFYFTTSEGIKKISATSGGDFTTASGYITQAGGVKALDINTRLNVVLGDSTGFLPADSAVAYRTLWGIKDANKNLILGSPSQRSVVYNSLLSLMLLDFNNLLKSLDFINTPGSFIDDGDYISTLSLPTSASAIELYNNLVALAAKIDNNITYAENDGTESANPPFELDTVSITGTVATVTFTNPATGSVPSQYFNSGDNIYLSGTYTVGTSGSILGNQTITLVDDATWTITFNTTAVGTVTLSTDSVINSGTFRAITAPSQPFTPATHQQLEDLQTYLQSIINALQSLTTEVLTANTTGTGVPLTLSTASITAGVATINFSMGDPRDYLIAGNYIVLAGFTATTGTINGLQLIASVTATTLTFSTTATDPITVSGGATINKVILFTNDTASSFIDTLDITTTASVFVDITIPSTINSDHFYQIYRSAVVTAIGTDILSQDIFPNDELQLVYEAFPSAAELAAGEITVLDVTPDTFRGANLYTNPDSGEGILQANDIPPFALDINLFKNTVFYANTRTLQRLSLNLLGLSDLLAAVDGGTTPKILISDGISSNVYNFVLGVQQIVQITTIAAASISDNGPGDYFTIYNANDFKHYYVWYQLGTSTDPTVAGLTGIEVVISASDSADDVAQKTLNVLNTYITDFSAVSPSSATIDVTNVDEGFSSSPTTGTMSGGFAISITTSGRGELATQEIRTITCVADTADSLAGKYFLINDITTKSKYYVWYDVSGSGSDPAVSNAIGIQVDIITNDSANTVASKTNTALQNYPTVFTSTVNTDTLTITNYYYGYSTDSGAGTSGFSVVTTQQGALEVLLSQNLSPSIAVDATARSFVSVINKNKREIVFGYYLSGAQDVPGKMLLEGKALNPDSFYLLINDSGAGAGFGKDFSPDLNGEHEINDISTGSVITTTDNHNLINLDKVLIVGSDSTPNIDGYWEITVLSPTTFSIPTVITGAGTTGSMIVVPNSVASDDEALQNRIYYSKFSQPEAVPIVNFIDVGAADTAILRILPIRDSLFIFKEDGLYRISGEIAPFVLNLFDSSFILLAADSLGISNNIIYGWTSQGVSSLSESGATPSVSRPIDDVVLPLSSASFTSFPTATWGAGYDSDNSYIVFTVKETTDTIATIAYRYSNLTKSWTTFDKTNTCGIVNTTDDRLYLGAGDTNYIEQERKLFNRTDYADREIIKDLTSNNAFGTSFQFSDVTNVSIGDVFLQTQYVNIYSYNVLLEKLDIDPGLSAKNYLSILEAQAGDNMRSKIVALATKLDADPDVQTTTYASSIAQKTGNNVTTAIGSGTVIITQSSHGLVSGRVITTSDTVDALTGDFTVTVIDANHFSIPATLNVTSTLDYVTSNENFLDIQACYNKIISLLNADTGVSFSNYSLITHSTIYESIVMNVNTFTKTLTVNLLLDYIAGPISIFEAINSTIIYSPQVMGDPLGLKHIYESTVMYANKSFSSATVSFATDLMPEFIPVTFNGSGNGIFGNTSFGGGLFGGISNSAPFRTFIPRNCQRCRYLLVQHTHNVAREQYGIYGITITGNVGQSSRGYR